ncbi:BTB/POZ domain-containing protein KCTD9-like isoform X2 [Anneissia japonica]|uniref:BTB/POZ domain-containing protein KCTD9-like isoform X2 n=1 Tax=Anneissia japonica TaxID=1529436 RepID=UPI001425A778|nr:BTB/POZ domain-containing protein KCTD9-like isoform X2 [Anneissia japonica]
MHFSMKRVIVQKNGTTGNGKLIFLAESLEMFLHEANRVLNMSSTIVYTEKGGVVEDIRVIRDDEVLYLSEGEPFVDPKYAVATRPLVNKCNADDSNMSHDQNDWVSLNVGGKRFTTTRSTLIGREPSSMLARMFSGNKYPWCSAVDSEAAFLIDRSPKYFEPILNYLRHGQLILDADISPRGVLEEAKFYGLQSLIHKLEVIIKDREPKPPPGDHTPITRREFVKMLMMCPSRSELRCQGVNFCGADLTRLDLRFVNFKLANLSGANLSGADMSFCSLERANLAGAIMDGANLQGVKMVLANLEGASLRGCNFEDPCGAKTNMEGVNMKGVDLESSQMTGVNLRVATLKNANLHNCNLRGAVLAGTDLENCILSGCDLQDANLRGANVKNASFEEMVNPLHMSQSVR